MSSKWIIRRALVVFALATAIVVPDANVRAQASPPNLPPTGAYQPIPNFTGVGAELQFREAINDRFSGAQPIAPSIASPTFDNLPAEQDGMLSATPRISLHYTLGQISGGTPSKIYGRCEASDSIGNKRERIRLR